jgi:hypothetical protein
MRFRITSSNPIPAGRRARELGSGVLRTVVKVPVQDDMVELVVMHVLVLMDSPVSPAKIPVPPVNTESVITVPFRVPLPVKVPKRVPPANTSMNVPLDVNVVVVLKMRVPMFVVVKVVPDTASTPEPVKLESKTQRQGLAVAVTVEVPVSVPVVVVESARAGMARPPIITRAIRVAASKRIIEASWRDTTLRVSFVPHDCCRFSPC